MSDLEQLLPPRLHALADDLTPALDLYGQADAARALHRRQRRTRVAVTAVAAAVIAVAVGVPTAFSALSAPDGGRVADPGPTATSTSAPSDPAAEALAQARLEAEQAAASAAAESAAAAASPGPYTMPIDPAAQALIATEEAKGAAELTDALVALHSPVHLGTPAAGAACPDAAAVLTEGLGTHVGYEQGALTDGRGGCQWSNDVDIPLGLAPEVRLTVGVNYQPEAVERVVSGQQHVRAVAQPGACLTVPDTRVDPRAMLQRCVNGGWVEWYLFVPTANGAGTWVLEAFIGNDLSSPPAPGAALTEMASLVTTDWPA